MSAKKKLFIAEGSNTLLETLLSHPEAKKYEIETASSGTDCFEKIRQFVPDLIILDLLLPEIHGIAILHQVKKDPLLSSKGVVIASDHILIQNYEAAIQGKASYFLNKPFTPHFFFTLVERYFSKGLTPEPFHTLPLKKPGETPFYTPNLHAPNRYLRFWGTRGSNSVSGAEFLRFGGSTTCLEIHYDEDIIIIDAGTGICTLGEKLLLEPIKKHYLFFSHTHWDHITGFPFFKPIYDLKSDIEIWTPVGFEKTAKDLFTDMLTYTYFPVRLEDIKATLYFNEMQEGSCITVGNIKIWTHYAFHPGMTLCFKVQVGDKTFGIVTDNEFLMGYHGSPKEMQLDHPLMQPHLSLIQFLKGCDFIIHEAQYFPEEYLSKVGWGHSSVTNGAILMRETGIKEWIVTHHDPEHTDEILHKKLQLQEDILKENQIECRLIFAYEGLIYPL